MIAMNSEEQILRQALLDILDSQRWHFFERGERATIECGVNSVTVADITGPYANQQRQQFCDQVIARVRELMHKDVPEDEMRAARDILANRDMTSALSQTLTYLKGAQCPCTEPLDCVHRGFAHHGYFYDGWAGQQLQALLAEREHREATPRLDAQQAPEEEAPQDEEIRRLAAMEIRRMRELALDKGLAGLMTKGLITRVDDALPVPAINEKCFRTACTSQLAAYWWNTSTRQFYCHRCADLIDAAAEEEIFFLSRPEGE